MALNILFVDQDNAGLSIMAEALLNAMGYHDLRGFSAGLVPGRDLDASCLEALACDGVDIRGLQPKPLDIYAMKDALPVDHIITLHKAVEQASFGDGLGDVPCESWLMGDPREAFDHAGERRELARQALLALRNRLTQRVGVWRLQVQARQVALAQAGMAVA